MHDPQHRWNCPECTVWTRAKAGSSGLVNLDETGEIWIGAVWRHFSGEDFENSSLMDCEPVDSMEDQEWYDVAVLTKLENHKVHKVKLLHLKEWSGGHFANSLIIPLATHVKPLAFHFPHRRKDYTLFIYFVVRLSRIPVSVGDLYVTLSALPYPPHLLIITVDPYIAIIWYPVHDYFVFLIRAWYRQNTTQVSALVSSIWPTKSRLSDLVAWVSPVMPRLRTGWIVIHKCIALLISRCNHSKTRGIYQHRWKY